jgi:peptidyl-prolyl cis-trans isomerase SurA
MAKFAANPNDLTGRAIVSARWALLAAITLIVMFAGGVARAQQVVDRIIARVEGDVLLQSDLRELGQFQQLQGGNLEPESTRLNELIDQWVIEHEGQAAQFSQPSDGDVNAAVDQLKKNIGGEDVFRKRLKETGLTAASVRRIVARILFYSRYLDYKFRTAAQIDAAAEEKYYNAEFAEQMKARGEKLPTLESVRPAIHELLVQEDISKRAAEWLTESRSRIKVEMVPAPDTASTVKQLEQK